MQSRSRGYADSATEIKILPLLKYIEYFFMMPPHWSHFTDIIPLLTVWNAVTGHQDRWDLDSILMRHDATVGDQSYLFKLWHGASCTSNWTRRLAAFCWFPPDPFPATPQVPGGLFVLCLINDVCDTRAYYSEASTRYKVCGSWCLCVRAREQMWRLPKTVCVSV